MGISVKISISIYMLHTQMHMPYNKEITSLYLYSSFLHSCFVFFIHHTLKAVN